MFRSAKVFVFAAMIAAGGTAAAQDIEGSSDHPLVGRYEGSTIVFYKHSDFDEAALLQAPHDYNALLEKSDTKNRSGADWLKTEGAVTEIRYEGPAGRSSLEVFRNFESALKEKGFEALFSCADAECLTGTLRDNYLIGEQLDPTNGLSTAYFDHARYTLEKLDRRRGTVYAAVLVGESQGVLTTFVRVVQTKAMEGDKIVVLSADEMSQAIKEKGHVDVYGIYFDFDKDTLKPESEPTLDEIAELLKGSPDMKLEIVGHTDNKGAADYNMDLSERRAEAVVDALVEDYDIAEDQLDSSGAGMSEPVESNDTEEGRAKNRRVELRAK